MVLTDSQVLGVSIQEEARGSQGLQDFLLRAQAFRIEFCNPTSHASSARQNLLQYRLFRV